jgi:parallel beta-helix repeat protein
MKVNLGPAQSARLVIRTRASQLSRPGAAAWICQKLTASFLALIAIAVLGLFLPRVAADAFVVTTAEDRLPENAEDRIEGSLRQAILDANARPTTAAAPHLITFAIAGDGPHTIRPVAALPRIEQPVHLLGPVDSEGRPLVELDGSQTGGDGLQIWASHCRVYGLAINRCPGAGIRLVLGGNSRIQGNFIGTDVTGTVALRNTFGVDLRSSDNNLIGGTSAADRNLISGNSRGINLNGSNNNRILGNYIGTDVTGALALGNDGGVFLERGDAGGPTTGNHIGEPGVGAGNIISGNGKGIVLTLLCDGNTVQNNLIGTDATGTLPLGNPFGGININAGAGNFIGGSPEARNVISANGVGIDFDGGATGNTVVGNFIGTDRTGNAPLGNPGAGILVRDGSRDNLIGSSLGNENVIAANGEGIRIQNGAFHNRVERNRIGLYHDNGGAPGNVGYGVVIQDADSNWVSRNTIAFNTRGGVRITSGTGNSLTRNSIFGNGGLGIDLGPEGWTLNDPGDTDTGANNLQNYPLPAVFGALSGSWPDIRGVLESTPNTQFIVEFFATAGEPCGLSGKDYLGGLFIVTDGFGRAHYTLSGPFSFPEPVSISATATDLQGNTSEFSPCQALALPPGISDIPDQVTAMNLPVAVPFTVNDFNFGLHDLVEVSAESSNPELVPNLPSHLAFAGEDTSRMLTITPALDRLGIAIITLTATDFAGLSATRSFLVQVVRENGLDPVLAGLVPVALPANGDAFTLVVRGALFDAGDQVEWNGASRPTTFVNDHELHAAIPAADLVSTAELATVLVTVRTPAGVVSNPKAFTITGVQVSRAESDVALPGQSVTASTPPADNSSPGVSASVQNTGFPEPVIVTTAVYDSLPVSNAPVSEVGGGYGDVKVSGADPADSATSLFYYPADLAPAVEATLTLLYFNGNAWVAVLSSGGLMPVKDTTDNPDGTTSGGRFTVTFDQTSTPRLTELSGTVFTLTLPDSAPPLAVDDSFERPAGDTFKLPVADLLQNDSDPDNDPLTLTGVSAASARGGTVQVIGTWIIYRSVPGDRAPDSFIYTITDGRNGLATATVRLTVPPDNRPAQNILRGPGLVGGHWQVTFAGIPGRTYLVEFSTDLQDWALLGTLTVGGDGVGTFTDPDPPGATRFYRLVLP